MRIALGIDDYLADFARLNSALTWKQLVRANPEEWKSRFLQLMNDPNVTVLFNLDGVDVWGGVTRANTGRRTMTDWELLQIMQNRPWWPRISWRKGGGAVRNPFGER